MGLKLNSFISSGYKKLKSFQMGGNLTSTPAVSVDTDSETKQKLLPYFAYFYTKATNPQKYGSVQDFSDFEEWSKLVAEDGDKLSRIAAEDPTVELSAEESAAIEPSWELAAQVFSNSEEGAITSAAKGAKLAKLKEKGKKPAFLLKAEMKAEGKEKVTKKQDGGLTPHVISGPTIAAKKQYINKKVVTKTNVPNTPSASPDLDYNNKIKPSVNSHSETTSYTKRVPKTAINNTSIVTKKAGSKLVKKGGKKKCTCGCDLVLTKAIGGKMVDTCACKCGGKVKMKKK